MRRRVEPELVGLNQPSLFYNRDLVVKHHVADRLDFIPFLREVELPARFY